MDKKQKEAIEKLEHYINITPYWKSEEYTDSEIDEYIKTLLDMVKYQQAAIKDITKSAIMVAFDDINNDTELLLRVLLKYGKIELKNGKYTRSKREWEENMTLVGFQTEREKCFYIKEDSLDEYTKQLESKVKELEKYKAMYEDLCD